MKNTPISTAQLKKLHTLLNLLGWMPDKADIVLTASGNRTISSKELYFDEAKALIKMLAEFDPAERLKSLIFSLGYRSGILYGSTGADKKMNAAKLNLFLKSRGAVKKDLNAMNYTELLKTHRQFEAMAANISSNTEQKRAGAAVKMLLEELEIVTA